MKKIFITIKIGTKRYYILKIIRHGFNVYCIPPDLGMHYSLHTSGESHFKSEGKISKPGEEKALVLMMGEAGTPVGEGIICTPLENLGHAIGICNMIIPINTVSEDFKEFSHIKGTCFTINTEIFPQETTEILIGVWAVPERNKISFDYNNPNIPEDLLFKVTDCEPQIWIYAHPF